MPADFSETHERPGAPSAGGLLFGEHDGAVRLACFAKAHGDRVRGVNFEKMMDAPRERRAVQPMAQHLRDQNVRHALDVVAGMRMPLHPHAQARAVSRSSARPAAA